MEEFLEDINNMLNSGEVPNLFAADEYEQIIQAIRPIAKEHGVSEQDRDGIFSHFIGRVQDKLHIVLCMSPVGDSFRARCRMFPSLVNCCTIDWFTEWPREALLSVAKTFFEQEDLGDDSLKVQGYWALHNNLHNNKKITVLLLAIFCDYKLCIIT